MSVIRLGGLSRRLGGRATHLSLGSRGLRGAGGGGGTFPLLATPESHFLLQANGTPFQIRGRSSWGVLTLSPANAQAYVDDTVSRGFNAVEVMAVSRHQLINSGNPAMNGSSLLPFTNVLAGGAWSGSTTYGNINNEAPDFTTLNTSYWQHVDSFLSYCQSKSVAVLLFPAYLGVNGNEGWLPELIANGSTKVQSYGASIASRYANQGNVIWCLLGDIAPAAGSETTAAQALANGLKSVSTLSTVYTAQGASNAISTDDASSGSYMTMNGAYSFTGSVSTYSRNAYSRSPVIPSFLIEEPYDEEGPAELNRNSAATQPVRRYIWWGVLGSIGGYMAGNGYVWPFGAGYSSHLNTVGAQDLGRLNVFMASIDWWRLVPDGLGGIGALVTAGGGTINTTDYVSAAAAALGDLLVAYIGPGHSGSVTIDMTKMRGSTTARWFDPTNGTYTAIAGSPFANTGTRAYTPTGNNSAGEADWVLRLDA